MRLDRIRVFFVALALGLFLVTGAALAQQVGVPATPSPRGGNNAEMWRGVRQGMQGYVSIPNKQAGVLIQSEGEIWRHWHNGPIPTYGSWLLLATIVVLALFFAIRGRLRIEAGASGRLVDRFGGFERFVHWMTATSFIVLALTGLITLYGRYVLLPVMGPEAFSSLAGASKQAHNFISFAFSLGVVLMFILWVRHNLPTRADLTWLARGGGFFRKGSHPPAYKFNAGQKLVFWAVVILGTIISVSGFMLMFPFYIADMHGMQTAQIGHGIVGLLMIAMIIGHIYIGTIGMEGAFDAMGSGKVDENWAREHHGLWVAEMKGKGAPATAAGDD